MNKKISLLKLYLIFLKIGAVLLGGGYVILPILTSELCKKRNLVEENDLIDYFALSQSLPGIVAANISMFTGYKLRGKFGAAAAMLGIITVPFIIIVLLSSIFSHLAGNSYIEGVFWGIGISVTALIILTIREIWQKSNRSLFFYLIYFLALTGLIVFKLSPVDTIIIFSIAGVILKKMNAGRKKA